ncbi:MAG: glycine--tRNA ligase [Candidatus Woesearchaeota archaeon]
MGTLDIDGMASFCKRKGFVYPNSEIYGGLAGFFDLGPFGVELNNNIKAEWWKTFVRQREDIVGIDGCIISHPSVWRASGHVECFEDMMLSCTKCKERIRADHFIEEKLNIPTDGMKSDKINSLVKEKGLKCPKCGGVFENVDDFNLMFKTNVGPVENENSVAYLRPETAQLIFTNFKLVAENARLKLPFGIAQIGKAFRNEISPRNFIFRCREFEQMEIEYFISPSELYSCPFINDVEDFELYVYSEEMQMKNKEPELMSVSNALERKLIKTPWHGYWLAVCQRWFEGLGAKKGNFRVRQHLSAEKSHYALDTWDLEYRFPFGWKELLGIANRTDFDLMQHIKYSGKDLSLYDEVTKSRIVPHVVAEPSFGVGRAMLVFLFDAYEYDDKRQNIVLKLHPKLAPIKVAVFPLLSNKEELIVKAREVFNLLKQEYTSQFDISGSIGRRYARQDEIGTPFCVTIDFQTLNDDSVTIRDRDTTSQERVKISELKEYLSKKIPN